MKKFCQIGTVETRFRNFRFLIHVYDIVRHPVTCVQFIESGHAHVFNEGLGGTEAFI